MSPNPPNALRNIDSLLPVSISLPHFAVTLLVKSRGKLVMNLFFFILRSSKLFFSSVKPFRKSVYSRF